MRSSLLPAPRSHSIKAPKRTPCLATKTCFAASLVVVAVLLMQKRAQPLLRMREKQVAYLAVEAEANVARDVKIEALTVTGARSSQTQRRKHAKGIAGSLMN